MTKEVLLDKGRGVLMGGAIGDTLGYPVEFISSFREIQYKYGEKGIEDFDLSGFFTSKAFDKAQISDDTQMSLYTIEGMLNAVDHDNPIITGIREAYLAWFCGQTGYPLKHTYDSELYCIEELNKSRAPGNTCLSALQSLYNGNQPRNYSKGCGGVMRVAPIGIYGVAHGWPMTRIAMMAGEAAMLTHLHPLSTYSSAALAVLIALCIKAEKIDSARFKSILIESLEILKDVYGNETPEMSEFMKVIQKAITAADSDLDDWEVIENVLGGGWVAEETLAIAIFSVLRHIDNFTECIMCAVNHGGDSDSTGAVAGNIIGAILGYKALPTKYTETIQLHELIISMADRICDTEPDNQEINK